MADAVAALCAADTPREERDRVVEAFRAVLRWVAILALAARAQFGPPGADARDAADVSDLLRALARRGLTDGQWLALARQLLRPYAAQPETHALPALVRAIHDPRGRALALFDALLAMRKLETVAHGSTGSDDDVEAQLARRVPQLAELLTLLEPSLSSLRLVVPQAGTDKVRLYMGATPPRGRFRREELSLPAHVTRGEPLLVDDEGRPVLALAPLVLVRPASAGEVDEVWVADGGRKDALRYVAIPSMAEHVEPEGLRAIEARIALHVGDEAGEEIAGATRPYRGLASFGPEHASLFFGREEETESLANRIRKSPLVTVTGPSGAGKSSLLSAGVIPKLAGFVPIVVRPGADPAVALSRRLAEELGEPGSVATIARTVREAPEAAALALARFAAERERGIVLMVDQAEELFTLTADAEARLSFARFLAVAGADEDGPVRVVLVVREDFFARLTTLPPLRGLAARVVEVVVAPDSDALLRALVLPARQFGYQFEDIALARRMVEAAEGANAALPLLSFCADRLWDARDRKWRRITIDAYLALGGVEGALASHAERTLAALTPAQQDAARALLVRMVTPEGTRAVVRRAELAGAARTADGAAPDALLVLDRLVDARLLVVREADDQAGGATVELVHEALLHHWSRLSAWLLADREGRARALALTQAARAWDARGRPRGLLWRDDVLADHRARDKRARLPLGALEASFLSASEDEERRERRASRRLAATGFGVVSLLALFLFVLWQRASSARSEERRAREDATLALAVAQAGRLAAEAASRESLGRPGEAVALLRAARTVLGDQEPGMRRKLAADLDRLDGLGAAALVLRGDAAPVADVAFSPDGARLAAAIGDAARVWDVAGEAAGGEPTTLRHEGPVWQLAFSPDGLRIATASADRTVRVWDARTGARIATLAHPSPVRCLAFSPDGARLATGAADGAVRVFDDPTALPRVLFAHGGAVHALAFHANDAVATASADRTVRLWDLGSQAAPRALGPHDEPVSTIAVSRGGGALLAVQRGGVSLWDLATSTQRARLGGQDRAVYGAAFSPDGAHVVTASSDRVAQVWSAATGAAVATLGGHDRAVQRVVYSSDGARIATASSDGTARLWDARSHVLLRVLRGHQGALSTLTFSPDGARLAIGSKAEDGVVRVFATASGARSRPLLGHGDDVYAAVFSPDGARVATSSKDRTARLWDARTGAQLAVLPHREQVYALSFSPDGSVVATASHDRTARLWDARTGRAIATLSGHEGYLPALAFSPRGDVLATASVDRTTRLWDVRTGTLRRALPAQDGAVFALAFSRDGAALSTLADDGTISFWDAASGALRGRQPVPSGYAEAAGSGAGLVAFGASDGTTLVWDVGTSARLASLPGSASLLGVAVSSDGSRLVTGGADRVARVYALPGAVPIAPLVGHDAGVLAVAASPDGRLAATGSADRTVRVWRADEGRLLQVLGGHEDKITAVAFSPDGRHVVSASQDDTARVWDVDVEHDPESVARRAGDATNLRVCRGTLEVVPVIPRPAADSVWADASSCASP